VQVARFALQHRMAAGAEERGDWSPDHTARLHRVLGLPAVGTQ
jgi:hypothetical protein